MSYWEHPKPVRRTRAVDPEAVASASVDLLDNGGLRALTVRAVASALGVAPASLYSRVTTADDLFDLALDAALADDHDVMRLLGSATATEPTGVTGVREPTKPARVNGSTGPVAVNGSTGPAAFTGFTDLMLAYFHHLVRHRWAGQVIGMRAPRGPTYLALSECMVTWLGNAGAADPLGAAYSVSNYTIGSALTAPMSDSERTAAVDPDIAPNYAHLHTGHTVDAETIFLDGLTALIRHATGQD